MSMDEEIDWLTPGDMQILTFLIRSLYFTPNNIAFNLNRDNRHVGRRCKEMAERGVLERVDDNHAPFYHLTDLGEAIVQERIDPAEVRERTRLESDEE